jgi:hypothetical protein
MNFKTFLNAFKITRKDTQEFKRCCIIILWIIAWGGICSPILDVLFQVSNEPPTYRHQYDGYSEISEKLTSFHKTNPTKFKLTQYIKDNFIGKKIIICAEVIDVYTDGTVRGWTFDSVKENYSDVKKMVLGTRAIVTMRFVSSNNKYLLGIDKGDTIKVQGTINKVDGLLTDIVLVDVEPCIK